MKILKFGGKSLSNGIGLENAISIIVDKVNDREEIFIVLSARGDTTNQLEQLLDLAKSNKDYSTQLDLFCKSQLEPLDTIDFSKEFGLIGKLLHGVRLTGDYTLKVKDLLLAQGELMSVKLVGALLDIAGIKNESVDSRLFLKTDDNFGSANVYSEIARRETVEFFKNWNTDKVAIITGFIASTTNGETTTLGRNGTNYSASLLANYLDVLEIESYTHVNGIYTANPELVSNARILKHVSYSEASELASFGASILHAKSILPLVDNNISLTILNTFDKDNRGTLIDGQVTEEGIKSISIQNEVVLISIIGKGLLGEVGIDARIFSSLGNYGISISVISQGSSERSVSFIIPKRDASRARRILLSEFRQEISINDIQDILVDEDVSVVTIVGQHIGNFANSLEYLKKNRIEILLINNTMNSNTISLIIKSKDVKKAVNIIHAQIFEAIKSINIAVVGKGTVGGALIDQILKSKLQIMSKKFIHLNMFAIAGSTKLLLNKDGISEDWNKEYDGLIESEVQASRIIDYAERHHLENLVVIDNTPSEEFVKSYTDFIESGFDIISSNKIANTQKYNQYVNLRECLAKYNASYLYETNVGAGLPIIDTIRVLHDTGENITRIKGVFSGSLSYLFNSFSTGKEPFSYFLKEAISAGFTEPDPREDLCGNDVARKLLILARELDLENEFDDIEIHNLVPSELRNGSAEEFLNSLDFIDSYYSDLKSSLEEGKVFRYVGELSGDLQNKKGILKVELVSVDKNSALGNLKGSDSIFEIFTESYQNNPITIIGAGAGAEVTARGVFGDLLRISDRK